MSSAPVAKSTLSISLILDDSRSASGTPRRLIPTNSTFDMSGLFSTICEAIRASTRFMSAFVITHDFSMNSIFAPPECFLWSSARSSLQISLQILMHSLQMYAVGPTMSFLTSLSRLPQNTQDVSVDSIFEPSECFLWSSATISLQISMHSLQMYTEGPAMSFLTSLWVLPQKLQRNLSSLCRIVRRPHATN